MTKLLPGPRALVGAGALALALLPLANNAPAQCVPAWDDTFSPLTGGGPNHNVWDMEVWDDGTGAALYVAGEFSGVSVIGASLVARWDGASWSALGSGIDTVTGTEIVRGLAGYDDGSGPALYAAGDFPGAGGVAAQGLVRWNGTSWSGVANITGNLDELAVFDLGSGPELFITGTVSLDGGLTDHEIVRWDGTSATPIADTNGWAYTLCVFDSGNGPELYAGGRFTMVGSQPAALVARWDGTSWFPLNSGFDGPDFPRVRSLKVFDDGNGPALYAAGRFTTAGGFAAENVARWDGIHWSPVGSNITGNLGAIVEDLEVFDDGQTGPALFACGEFTTAGGAPAANLARWDGTSWSPSGAGMDSFVACLHTFADDPTPSLYAGGGFAHVDGHQVQKLGRLDTCDQTGFCYGTDAACPCSNGGAPDTGCDLEQATGGVSLDLASFTPNGSGGGQAVFSSAGYPAASATSALLIRSRSVQSPTVFGDGLLCLSGSITRVLARPASSGTAGHLITHGAGAGTFYYQVWFRNLPATFCDPLAGFNTSNAYTVTWH